MKDHRKAQQVFQALGSAFFLRYRDVEVFGPFFGAAFCGETSENLSGRVIDFLIRDQ
jgi:hypothetical protein